MSIPLNSPTRQLSTPRLRKAPPRPMTTVELKSLATIADALIAPYEDLPSGSAVNDFEVAVQEAIGIMGRYFAQLEQVLAQHARLASDGDTASWLKNLHQEDEKSFWVVSTIVAAVYVSSPQVLATVNYPLPHRNPPELTEAADDLETGLLDPVIERGETYVRVPSE